MRHRSLLPGPDRIGSSRDVIAHWHTKGLTFIGRHRTLLEVSIERLISHEEEAVHTTHYYSSNPPPATSDPQCLVIFPYTKTSSEQLLFLSKATPPSHLNNEAPIGVFPVSRAFRRCPARLRKNYQHNIDQTPTRQANQGLPLYRANYYSSSRPRARIW